jgi:hypothetical protein
VHPAGLFPVTWFRVQRRVLDCSTTCWRSKNRELQIDFKKSNGKYWRVKKVENGRARKLEDEEDVLWPFIELSWREGVMLVS